MVGKTVLMRRRFRTATQPQGDWKMAQAAARRWKHKAKNLLATVREKLKEQKDKEAASRFAVF